MAQPPLTGRDHRERARLTFRRLVGLDRSGPPPPETRRGEPLRPWTIPNVIEYVRLAMLPVFLWLALDRGGEEGVGLAAVILFAAIGWSDYLDGIAARVTGQFSRLGALLDPLVDRLLIISGVVVCFALELLPRWALAVLVAREVLMLVLVRLGLRHGIDVEINWLGRAAVWPVMSALFLAMAGAGWPAEAALYLGLALALASTAKYLRDGAQRIRNRPSSSA